MIPLPRELAPPTRAQEIEFRVCFAIGTAFAIVAPWLLRRCCPVLCFHQPARHPPGGLFHVR